MFLKNVDFLIITILIEADDLAQKSLGLAHVQLSKVSWETESELKLLHKFQFTFRNLCVLVPIHFLSPKILYSMAHEPALNMIKYNVYVVAFFSLF